MDRREIMKRRLRVDAYWGLGNVSCHDIAPAPQPVNDAPKDGEDYYVIQLDTETGDVQCLPGDTEQMSAEDQ